MYVDAIPGEFTDDTRYYLKFCLLAQASFLRPLITGHVDNSLKLRLCVGYSNIDSIYIRSHFLLDDAA